MNYILKPSLEHITLVRIAARLWNQEDIRDLIGNFCIPLMCAELKDVWPKVEDRVKEKVSQLLLPECLKEKVLCVIKPIGFEIARWMRYYRENFKIIDLPNEFCWTPQGTVDERKTAELLIKDESIDIFKRYKISCIYCLENDILKLWKEVPEDSKKNVCNEKDPMNNGWVDLIVFWTYDIKGELSKIKEKIQFRYSPYEYACKIAAYGGNKVATEYFLQKLTSEERKVIVVEVTVSIIACARQNSLNTYTIFLHKYYSDILCRLLAHMDKEQQVHIFHLAYDVLICFLDWPWQSFFAETAGHLWNFLSKDAYSCLLKRISNKVIKGFKDFNYQKLLAEFWLQSPNAFKRFVLNANICHNLLSQLFEVGDINNIKLILHDATIAEKQNIISSLEGQAICKDLILTEKWSLLKFFIQECVSSRDKIINFKEAFQWRITNLYLEDTREKLKDKWNEFSSLLNDIMYESNKRKSVEDDYNEAKRFVTES